MKSKISNAYLNYFFVISVTIIILAAFYFIRPSIIGYVTYTQTQFSNNLSAENISFDQPGTAVRNININKDANITSATITLKGYRRYNYLIVDKTTNPSDGDGTRESLLYGSVGTQTRNLNLPKYFYNITNASMQITGAFYQSTVNANLWIGSENSAAGYQDPQWGSPGNDNALYRNSQGVTTTTITIGSDNLYLISIIPRFNQGDGWTSGGCSNKIIKMRVVDVTTALTVSDKTLTTTYDTGEYGSETAYNAADGTLTANHEFNFSLHCNDCTVSNCFRTHVVQTCCPVGSQSRVSITANNTGSNPQDVAIDTGNDGKIDINFSGTLSTTKYADINSSALISYLSTCSPSNGNCSVTIKFYSNKQGNVSYSNINITMIGDFPINVTIDTNGSLHYQNLSTFNDTTTINLNVSILQNLISNCSVPFGQDCIIPINFSSKSDGILEYSNLNIVWSDIKPPFFANNQTNQTSTSPRFNESAQINVTALDGINISRCIFSWNYTGPWENNTPFATNGTNVTLIFNQTLNVTRKPLVGIQVYCNDTSANSNQSEIFTVQVKNTPPTFNHSISAQSVVANNEFKFYFNASDVDLDGLTFSVNDTRFLSINSTNGTLNGTPTSSFIGTHTINVTVNDSESISSLVFDLTVSDSLNPQWSGNATNANSSFPKYVDVIQLNVTLTDNSALKNFTLTVDQNGVINNTNRTISGTSYLMSENVTVTSPQGTTNKWNVTIYDSAGNVNYTSTFTFITKDSSPQWSSNKTNATASSPKFSDVIQLNATITSNVNLKNYSLTLEQGTNITTVNRSISGSTYNIIENFTITSQQGTTNKWNVTFYDLGDGRNSTDTFTFVTASSSPQWSNNITNANLSFPKKGETVQVNVTITNNVQFTNYSFTFDQGGNATILNRTISGISWIVIENFTISANQGTTNRWNVTFRDVGGGSNSTNTFVLYTRNTLPTVTSFNITNDTTVNFNNKTYYITGNGTFSDADSNNSLLDREIRWLNGTTVIPNENGFSLNCAQYSNTNCAVGQNITAQMRVSDNSKEISNLSDWNASTFIIIDTVYPISFANLTAGNVSDNEGDGNIEINWTDDVVQINETYRLYKHTSKINSSNINQSTLIGSGLREGTQFFKDNSTTNGTTYWYALVTVNQDGFFNESVSSLSFNATPNDTIAPKIPAGFNVTGSSDTATLSWANVTQDVRNNPDNFGLQYVIYYGTNFNRSKELANESITSPSTKTVSSNSTTIAVSSSGTYHFVVTTLDDGANKNLTLTLTQNYGNASLTISSSSGSSGGSGGGGGGGGGASGGGGGGAGAPDTTSSSHFYQTVAKNTETILKIPTSKTISVFKIIFTPLNDLSSVTFDVKEHTESTTPVSISGNVYQYIEIKLNGIKSEDVSGALLQFKVSKSWINLGNYDPSKVVLNRYVATWTPLQTTKTDEDLDYIYYNAQSPGFSVFAVTAEKKPVQKPENASIAEGQPKIEEEIKQEPTLEQPLAAEGKPKEICGNNACKGFEWVTCPKDCYHFKLSVPSKFKIHWTLVVIGTISLFILFVIGDQALQYARKPKERKKSKTAEEEKKEALTETLRQERIRKQFDEIKKLQELIKQERNNQKEISSEIKFVEKQSMIIKPARIKPVKVEKTKAIKSVPSETISIFSKLFPSRPKEEIVAEKKTKLFNRFRLENGKVLLVRDKNDKTSFGIFKEVTSVLHGLAVVRVNPSTLGYTRDGVKFIWLSESEGDNCINPSDIEDLYNEIKEFVKKQKEGIVLLQGLDYIISGTNFKTLLRILRMLKDEISSRNNLIIVSFNQDLLNKEEAEKLKSEFNII